MRKLLCVLLAVLFVCPVLLQGQRGKKTRTSTVPIISSLGCASTSITGAATDACTATLSAAAPPGGQVITLASNSSAVAVQGSITVPAGAASAAFSASIAAVSASQTATITGSSGGATSSVTLQLNASAPKLTVNASTVAFGTVTVNSMSTQSVMLSSTGNSAVTISAVYVSGTGYSISGIATPLTLNPGQSATFNILFQPAVAGTNSGNVTISSNSSTGSATAITLTGTGQSVTHQVDLNWLAPTNSPATVAGYIVFRAPAGTSSYQQLNASAIAQTSFSDGNVASGQSYSYMVESVDSAGNRSVPSNIASAVIP